MESDPLESPDYQLNQIYPENDEAHRQNQLQEIDEAQAQENEEYQEYLRELEREHEIDEEQGEDVAPDDEISETEVLTLEQRYEREKTRLDKEREEYEANLLIYEELQREEFRKQEELFVQQQEEEEYLRAQQAETRRQEDKKAYADQVLDQIPQIAEELAKKADDPIPHRGLDHTPRTILKPSEWPKNAEQLQKYWQQLKLVEKYNDRFASLTNVLLHYIESYEKPQVKEVFRTLVQRTHNRDLPHYIEHIMSGSSTVFKISQVKNPCFDKVPKAYLLRLNILRIVKAKKDLLETLIASFDNLCIHRSLTNGINLALASAIPQETHSDSEDDDGWFTNYKKRPSEDAHLTENHLTPSGTAAFFECFSARRDESTNVIKSPAIDLVNGPDANLLTNQHLYGMKPPQKDCLYLPLFRSMYVAFHPVQQPLFHHFAAHEKGCNFMKNSVHHCFNLKNNEKFLATNLKAMENFLEADKALFVKNLTVTFNFDDTKDLVDDEHDLSPIKEETLFEILGRSCNHHAYLKTSKTRQILKASSQPYINETSLSPANMLQYEFPKAIQLLDEYFNHAYCLNLDANLALYNVHPTDHIAVKLAWKGIEGHRDFLTPYLLASTLYGTTQYAYNEEFKKLMSQAVHANNKLVATLLQQHFPNTPAHV